MQMHIFCSEGERKKLQAELQKTSTDQICVLPLGVEILNTEDLRADGCDSVLEKITRGKGLTPIGVNDMRGLIKERRG